MYLCTGTLLNSLHVFIFFFYGVLYAPGVLSSEFERHTQEVVRKLVSLLVTDRLTDRKDKQKLKLGRLIKKGGVEKI
jgi:hypothetical protein